MNTAFFKTLLITIALLVFSSSAFSHGRAVAQYGGVAKTEKDVVFELVREEAGTTLYVIDHGKPYPTKKLKGKLKITVDGEESETNLTSTGVNKMVSDRIIPDNAKVLVKLKKKNRRWVTVRYSF